MTPTFVGDEQQISISGGSQSPSDIASGRIAEMRRRSMSCIAWRASRSKNAGAFLNVKYEYTEMLPQHSGVETLGFQRFIFYNIS